MVTTFYVISDISLRFSSDSNAKIGDATEDHNSPLLRPTKQPIFPNQKKAVHDRLGLKRPNFYQRNSLPATVNHPYINNINNYKNCGPGFSNRGPAKFKSNSFYKKRFMTNDLHNKNEDLKAWSHYRQSEVRHESANSRLERIRGNFNSQNTTNMVTPTNRNIVGESSCSVTQDIDATDITVEVVNTQAHVEESALKFKMILNPKIQAAIRIIQEKQKEKQQVYPYAVTPNVTGITMHERFALL